MSALPISTDLAPWQPDPVRQRRADYTIEDVFDIPPDAPRAELVDGRVLPLPSPSIEHQEITSSTVTPPMWSYNVSGVNVLSKWFSYRRKKPSCLPRSAKVR